MKHVMVFVYFAENDAGEKIPLDEMAMMALLARGPLRHRQRPHICKLFMNPLITAASSDKITKIV